MPANKRPFNLQLRRWIIIAVAIIAAIWLLSFLWPANDAENNSKSGRWGAMRTTPTVIAATASSANIPLLYSALGSVKANRTVTVTSRVEGQLLKLYFTEGQHVEKGQLLAKIDPRTYQAALDQAEANLAQNKALLKNARQQLARDKKLVAQRSLARQELEAQQASVGQYLGAVKASEAQKTSAELNLGFTRIVSPISGYTGLRQTDPGNMISAGDSDGIVVVTQTDPIAVVFSLPQRIIPQLLPKLRAQQSLPVTALNPLDGSELAKGTLEFISNQIDIDTGSIGLKAMFDNSNNRLYPNQAVRIQLQTGVLDNAIIIPSHAVQLSDRGEFVWQIDSDNKVTKQFITSGTNYGDYRVITDGLNADATVVTQGVDRLKEGQTVNVEKVNDTSATATDAKAESDKQPPAASSTDGGAEPQ